MDPVMPGEKSTPPPLRLESLFHHADHIPLACQWIWEQWKPLIPHETLDSFAAAFRKRIRPSGIGCTVLALWEGEPSGIASLVLDDLPLRPELNPWLAEVYVLPSLRHRGIGRRLALRVMEEARSVPVPQLYLYTPDRQSFYAHLGWTVLEHVNYAGRRQVVMQATST